MSDHRKEMRTDDSTSSASSISDFLRELLMDSVRARTYHFSNKELETAKPEYILGRMLSTKSAISTDSALAEMNQRARDDDSLKTFASIGAGQCGTIYALKGTTMVIKLPNSPNKSAELYEDLKSHKAVSDAFRQVPAALRIHVQVPTLKMWVDADSDDFWTANTKLFHKEVQVPDLGIVSKRIYPLPYPVRSALVDTFAPKAIKDSKHDFLAKPENKDCLVRLYLGRRNDDTPPVQADKFHLRNFTLHVNEMERLKLETSYYARLTAQALAILHWRAGARRERCRVRLRLFKSDFLHRTISIWLLDFGMCQKFAMDDTGLKKLVDGFYWNDPYYPRPGSTNSRDKELWTIFSKHYLEVSAEFMKHSMPKAFIAAVEERGNMRSGNNLFG